MAKRLKGIPNLPFAPIVAALFGLVSAILVFATPGWLLERVVGTTGLSAVIAAARPPLGDTARTLIAVVAGLLVGLGLWLVLRIIEKQVHASRVGAAKRPSVPNAGRESGSPSAVRQKSGRSPIFAGQELGAPLMSDEALASGEELFLDPTMLDQAPQVETDVEPEAPLVLEAPDDGAYGEPAIQTVADPEPVVEEAAAIASPVFDMQSPDIAQPLRDSENEPSLIELVNRFETALDRRKTRVAAGEAVTPSPIAGTVANLRELIGGVHKSAA